MGPSTCRYGSKVSRNLGADFFEITQQNWGGSKTKLGARPTRRASDKKRGRDGTAYSDYHAPGGFLSHHLARISMAAVYWDAQHIDEGVRFLKQHARPHA